MCRLGQATKREIGQLQLDSQESCICIILWERLKIHASSIVLAQVVVSNSLPL